MRRVDYTVLFLSLPNPLLLPRTSVPSSRSLSLPPSRNVYAFTSFLLFLLSSLILLHFNDSFQPKKKRSTSGLPDFKNDNNPMGPPPSVGGEDEEDSSDFSSEGGIDSDEWTDEEEEDDEVIVDVCPLSSLLSSPLSLLFHSTLLTAPGIQWLLIVRAAFMRLASTLSCLFVLSPSFPSPSPPSPRHPSLLLISLSRHTLYTHQPKDDRPPLRASPSSPPLPSPPPFSLFEHHKSIFTTAFLEISCIIYCIIILFTY